MAYRAVAIANEFLRQPGALGNLTQMQLQKLSYMAHGWNLAINGEPLIADAVEAWDYGPVYRDLYDHTKYFGAQPLNRLITPSDDDAIRFFLDSDDVEPAYVADLGVDELSVIQQVWQRYGKLSGTRLSALTHQPGTPWTTAYYNLGKNAPIDQAAIAAHYCQLAERAQAASAA